MFPILRVPSKSSQRIKAPSITSQAFYVHNGGYYYLHFTKDKTSEERSSTHPKSHSWGKGVNLGLKARSLPLQPLPLPQTWAVALELRHTSSITLIGRQVLRTAVASAYEFYSRSCRKCLVWANTDWRDDISLTSFRLFPLEEASGWTKPLGKRQGSHYHIHSTLRWPAPNSRNETLPAPLKPAMFLPSLRGHHSPDSHLG